MKKTKLISILLAGALAIGLLAACGSSESDEEDNTGSATATTESSAGDDSGAITIKGIADETPHAELIDFVTPQLAEQGINVELVARQSDETTNEKLAVGEIDFNFTQHVPYLEEWNETNGFDLASAGAIHVEPITAYSDKYKSKDEIPEGAIVAIPNDATNEYRALSILEENGFIKLDDEATNSLKASVDNIKEYTRDIEIIELDSAQIIPTKDDYDFFITNTNKVLEAGIDSKRLFSESADSPYANIIAVRPEDVDNPAIVALVKALQADETRKFIEEQYDGAVIPANLDN